MPLLLRKPCFGRPERFVRGALERGVPFGDCDERGEQARGKTQCERCPVFPACSDVSWERIDSAPDAKAALETWDQSCLDENLAAGDPRRFYQKLGKLWNAFLDAIVAHGGWSNQNDDSVKLFAAQEAERKRKTRNEQAKSRRKRDAARRRGIPQQMTGEYFSSLQGERDRRAEQLKNLRSDPNADPRLTKLPDQSCERIADVWEARHRLARAGERVTGKAIAQDMMRCQKDYGLGLPSLTSRVYEDLRRIDWLEEDHGQGALWPAWVF